MIRIAIVLVILVIIITTFSIKILDYGQYKLVFLYPDLYHNIAVQTMKTLARLPCRGRSKTYHTYFYEPLETQEAIDKAVHWSMGFPSSFVASISDMQILPMMLDAANRFEKCPSDRGMREMVAKFGAQQIFPQSYQFARAST